MKARTMCQGTTLVVLQAAQVLFMDNTRPLSIVILSGAACRGPQRQVLVAGVNWGPVERSRDGVSGAKDLLLSFDRLRAQLQGLP